MCYYSWAYFYREDICFWSLARVGLAGGLCVEGRTYVANRGFRTPNLGDVLKLWQGFGAYCRVNFKMTSICCIWLQAGCVMKLVFFFCIVLWVFLYFLFSVGSNTIFSECCILYPRCSKPSVSAVVHFLSISSILRQGVSPVPCSLSAREKCIRWYHCVWLWSHC